MMYYLCNFTDSNIVAFFLGFCFNIILSILKQVKKNTSIPNPEEISTKEVREQKETHETPIRSRLENPYDNKGDEDPDKNFFVKSSGKYATMQELRSREPLGCSEQKSEEHSMFDESDQC